MLRVDAMSAQPLTLPIPTALQRLQRRLSTIEFVHLPHDRWPLRRSATVHKSPEMLLSILDSSFNPPTLAHLAIANAPLPTPLTSIDGSNSSPKGETLPRDYDAKLLLLSIRNADKILKPNDATYRQRLEMVVGLARDVVGYDESGQPTGDANVAVAVIAEPLFADKSRLLLAFLRRRLVDLGTTPSLPSAHLQALPLDQSVAIPNPRLIFLLGLDTLSRLCSLQNYGSEEIMRQDLHFLSLDGDDSRIVCARRIQRAKDSQDEILDSLASDERDREALSQAEVHLRSVGLNREYLDSGRITLIDIRKDEWVLSSTELRDKVRCGDDTWKKMTTPHIVDYILDQNLYV